MSFINRYRCGHPLSDSCPHSEATVEAPDVYCTAHKKYLKLIQEGSIMKDYCRKCRRVLLSVRVGD